MTGAEGGRPMLVRVDASEVGELGVGELGVGVLGVGELWVEVLGAEAGCEGALVADGFVAEFDEAAFFAVFDAVSAFFVVVAAADFAAVVFFAVVDVAADFFAADFFVADFFVACAEDFAVVADAFGFELVFLAAVFLPVVFLAVVFAVAPDFFALVVFVPAFFAPASALVVFVPAFFALVFFSPASDFFVVEGDFAFVLDGGAEESEPDFADPVEADAEVGFAEVLADEAGVSDTAQV